MVSPVPLSSPEKNIPKDDPAISPTRQIRTMTSTATHPPLAIAAVKDFTDAIAAFAVAAMLFAATAVVFAAVRAAWAVAFAALAVACAVFCPATAA